MSKRTISVTLTEPQYDALVQATEVGLEDLDGRYVPFGSLYYRTKAATLERALKNLVEGWQA